MHASILLPTLCGVMMVATALADCGDRAVEVPPGVCMPFVSLGTGSGLMYHHVNVTQILNDWFDVGGEAVDTALNYRNQGIVGGSLRTGIFVTTKIPCTDYVTARKNILLCLKLLRLSSVDVMLIHSPQCFLGGHIKDTWRALEEFQKEGKIKSIGVSNFLKPDFEELQKTARKWPPAVNQISYSVSYHDDRTLAYCKQIGVTVMSYSPLCGGAAGSSCKHGNVLTLPEVNAIALKRKVSPAQIALKWVVSQGIPLASSMLKKSYMKEDLDLWSWGELTAEEMKLLSSIFKPRNSTQLYKKLSPKQEIKR